MANTGYLQERPTGILDDYFIELNSKCGMILEHAEEQGAQCERLGHLSAAELCGAIRQFRAKPFRQIHLKSRTVTVENRFLTLKERYEPKRPMVDWCERDYEKSLRENPCTIMLLDTIVGVLNTTDDLLEFKKACNAFTRLVYGQGHCNSERAFDVYDKNTEAVRPRASISRTTAEQIILI